MLSSGLRRIASRRVCGSFRLLNTQCRCVSLLSDNCSNAIDVASASSNHVPQVAQVDPRYYYNNRRWFGSSTGDNDDSKNNDNDSGDETIATGDEGASSTTTGNADNAPTDNASSSSTGDLAVGSSGDDATDDNDSETGDEGTGATAASTDVDPTDNESSSDGDVTTGDTGAGDDLKDQLKPSEIVTELDRYIVGQKDAKRAVAVALRNRWRRKQLPEEMRKEIMPRNVLLVGPTGCGKTEVARRMAKLNDAPFVKVEATKFTEVGYHGRDVDKIIADLMDISIQLTRKRQKEKLKKQVDQIVEEKLLQILIGPNPAVSSRESFRDMLRQGALEEQVVEVDVPQKKRNNDMTFGEGANPNIVAMIMAHEQGGAGGSQKQKTERVKLPISKARASIFEVELDKLLAAVDIKQEAINAVEESGIVFFDEMDKICSASGSMASKSADASAEGVQRDLLPLVEGTTISTKYGNVNTDYILFVASGAFHAVKPSDLLPELQGRFPVRVELKGLSEQDLYKILTEPVTNVVRQQIELLKTEGLTLVFEDEAIREIARMAALLNRSVENIGARRLHTVMERIMEQISFEAAEMDPGTTVTINKDVVKERLKDVTTQTDLSRFIL